MKKIIYFLILFFITINCSEKNIRSEKPTFKIVDNKFKYPEVNVTSYDESKLRQFNIKKCIYYRSEINQYDNKYHFLKYWISNYDKLGKVKSKEYFNFLKSDQVVDTFNSTTLLNDTSYWQGNIHVFKIATDSTREFYFSKYKVENNIGQVEYDSSYVVYRNGLKKYCSYRYDFLNNLVFENLNGKIQKRKYKFKNNKVVGIDFYSENSRLVKKLFFKYNSKGQVIEFLHANNRVKNSNAFLKKLTYDNLGLIILIEHYKLPKSNFEEYVKYGNSSSLIQFCHLSEKYKWIKY